MNPSQLIQNRSVRLIFRDCLKLASRMVDEPARITAIRKLLKHEFHKNKDVINPQQIRNLKLNAVRGISNYIIYTVKKQYIKPDPHHNILNEQDEQEPPAHKI